MLIRFLVGFAIFGRGGQQSHLRAGFYGTELYPNGTGDVVKPAVHPEAPIGAPFMSGNWQVGTRTDTPADCAAGEAPVVSLRPG